ncbi:active regulator of SIRT1-like [Adelges cooleyi]|uniref:active regulator of SIRT1-like n=1 Tax=Adelges cooleyi TaxID=133065 RepID=UPI00217FFF2C|nr:active regulator of SIRT1-like [Adelges cooleyi]
MFKMSYSTLKKALKLFEGPTPDEKLADSKQKTKKSSNIKKSICKKKFQHSKSVFKVQLLKSDANKSIKKIQEQIRNEKDLNLVHLNLERLKKLDRTSCVNNTTYKLIEQRYQKPSTSANKEEKTVFTDEDFEKFEREYFQN